MSPCPHTLITSLSESILSASFSSDRRASFAHFYYACRSLINMSSFLRRSSIRCSRKVILSVFFDSILDFSFFTLTYRFLSYFARSMAYVSFSCFMTSALDRLRTSFMMSHRSCRFFRQEEWWPSKRWLPMRRGL